ncbi:MULTISPECIES: DUF2569 family protein [Brucella/Ochrobactrum group]|jgi:hypothetical protein|uniref:DUF2569 domain-containing protein n=1 Tax=Brucella pseudintermedia TaxID=370111 RepID=A0ABY5U991_9HYPH|nr:MULTISPECIES: DUF2569 family protein [Brucella/Ochrobactrum group]KAB2679233.1 DUF2569 domain-containing protein [Brucella pseudintermedia]NKE77787.1 DUF2569 domain-containing protein [Ochrobactrum sp. MC-1LL]UWL59431.1 DUF2569 domain-containing protein [Brucella pseudintermedia]
MFIDFFKKEPVGIGGFLLIPIIAVISSTIFISLDIFYTLNAYSADIIYEIYYSEKLLVLSIVFVIILQSILIILGITSLYLAIRRDLKTKNALLTFFILKVLMLNMATVNLIGLSYHFILDSQYMDRHSFISNSVSLLFVPYLILSRRVKNTFTTNQSPSGGEDQPA